MNIGNVLLNAEKSAEINITAEQGDFIDSETGLLICGKCNTPKQCRVFFAGIERTPMCLCKCKSEELKRKQEAEENKRRKAWIANLRERAFNSAYMHNWTIDNDDGKNRALLDIVKKYSENFDEILKTGQGLILYGDIGSGKTYAACEIINALIDKGHPCLFTNFSEILNVLQNGFERAEYIEELSRYDLIVFDDLGTERATEYAHEQIYGVIDNRYRSGKPMIFTTNLVPKTMSECPDYFQRRIYSRVLERCVPIKVSTADKRADIAKKRFEEFRKLF